MVAMTTYNFIDLTGRQFGRWLVLSRAANRGRKVYWLVECQCPKHTRKEIARDGLTSGDSQSCGCLNKELSAKRCTIHGETRAQRGGRKVSVEWAAVNRARGRCVNPRNKRFKDYGGRGIEFRFPTVADAVNWVLEILGRRPSPRHEFDRIDNDGHYESGNLRWATKEQVANNKRNNHLVTYHDRRMTLTEAIRHAGDCIAMNTARARIASGWSIEREVEQSVRRRPPWVALLLRTAFWAPSRGRNDAKV